MSDYVTLLGAEEVSHAANRMTAAAEAMQRAADTIDGANRKLIEDLASITYRNEEMLRGFQAMKPAAPKTDITREQVNDIAQALDALRDHCVTKRDSDLLDVEIARVIELARAAGVPE